jgi:hypothetical protein
VERHGAELVHRIILEKVRHVVHSVVPNNLRCERNRHPSDRPRLNPSEMEEFEPRLVKHAQTRPVASKGLDPEDAGKPCVQIIGLGPQNAPQRHEHLYRLSYQDKVVQHLCLVSVALGGFRECRGHRLDDLDYEQQHIVEVGGIRAHGQLAKQQLNRTGLPKSRPTFTGT